MPNEAFDPAAALAPINVLLASASPRRRELLAAAGIACEVVASNISERMRPGEPAESYARRLAVEKAEDVAARRPGERRPVVAADTVVVIGETVLGKPESAADAAAMLRLLSGKTHQVITGVCVLVPGTGARAVESVRTEVRFTPLSEEEIAGYVATGEPLDKAGAYAIQGRASRFVERIDGCYFNVVGLPVPTLYRMLKRVMSDMRDE